MPVTAEMMLPAMQRWVADHDDITIPLDAFAQTRWVDTGLESLALMELVLHLEQVYQCTVSNAVLAEVETFGDLAHVIAGLTAQEASAC